MASRHLILALILATALAACGDDKPASNQTAPDAKPVEATPMADAQPAAAPAADIAGGLMTKDELAAKICFFTQEEVQAALGFAVPPGKPDTKNLASYGSANCRYEGQDNVLQINAFWVDASQIAATRQYQSKLSAGNLEKLPDDPDGAYLQYQPELGGALHYMRRNVMIEVRPMTWRDDNATMKAKLLSLKRGP